MFFENRKSVYELGQQYENGYYLLVKESLVWVGKKDERPKGREVKENIILPAVKASLEQIIKKGEIKTKEKSDNSKCVDKLVPPGYADELVMQLLVCLFFCLIFIIILLISSTRLYLLVINNTIFH